MKLLTKKQQESYENVKISYIYKEKFENKSMKNKILVKLEIIAIIQRNIEIPKKNIVYLKKFL